MKLYYSTGACSLSPHIVLKELGLPYTLVKVDMKKKLTEDGQDFLKITKKGQVPAIQLDSGEVLTEGVAIVQYLQSLVPEKEIVPQGPGLVKYRQIEWLNFITSELHKSWSPLFRPDTTDEEKNRARSNLASKFLHLEEPLTKSVYLMGDNFTAADAYLFTVLSWSKFTQVELPLFLTEYLAKVASRPAVQAALKDEGLIK